MKRLIFSILIIITSLLIYKFSKNQNAPLENRAIFVSADASFLAKWGPGPALADLFKSKNNILVHFIDSPSTAMTLKKISLEATQSNIDVVVGLDQFDLARTTSQIKWKELKPDPSIDYAPEISFLTHEKFFLPFDWAPMAFVARKDLGVTLKKLDDLLQPKLKGRIALEDPRTSTPGLQFLVWVFTTKTAEQAKDFLQKLNQQAHSYSPSWSTAYGLFTKKQTDLVFSYVTSPFYHLIEEKDDSYISLEFQEAHPVQIEFAGVPETCKNCADAILFANFLQSDEAQKILMMKNYMLPVINGIKESTPFEKLKKYKTAPHKVYTQKQLDEWIQIWSEIRTGVNH